MKDTEDAPLLATAKGNGHYQDKESSDTKKANGLLIATRNTLA